VRQRRLELGLTQREAALTAKVSDTTWLTVERGEKVSGRTLAGVERALRWRMGSAAAVADGREPDETGGSTRTLEERLEVLEAELRALFPAYKPTHRHTHSLTRTGTFHEEHSMPDRVPHVSRPARIRLRAP
jgi:transcriptional regulator with XRE-family HTH domain